MKEYEILEAKIRDRDEEVVQYNSILYTATAAILAFAFQSDNYLFFLLPYVVIFPIYKLSEGTRRFMCRISAYLYVFHEGYGKEFQWERRHHIFDSNIRSSVVDKQKHGKFRWYLRRMMARSHYVLITLVCAFLSTYTVLSDSLPQKWPKIVFIWALTMIITISMVRNFTDWPKVRTEYIAKWREIKAAEEQQARKRDNTRNPQ